MNTPNAKTREITEFIVDELRDASRPRNLAVFGRDIVDDVEMFNIELTEEEKTKCVLQYADLSDDSRKQLTELARHRALMREADAMLAREETDEEKAQGPYPTEKNYGDTEDSAELQNLRNEFLLLMPYGLYAFTPEKRQKLVRVAMRDGRTKLDEMERRVREKAARIRIEILIFA